MILRSSTRHRASARRAAWPAALAALLLAVPAWSAPKTEPDSIVIQTLGELPSQFVDRFITRVAYADTGAPPRGQIVLSQDGLHMAFVHDRLTSKVMVVDGVAGREFRDVRAGVFSETGGRFAYLAEPSGKSGPMLVLDGRELALDEPVTWLGFSPDGRRFAHVIRERGTGTSYVVRDVRVTDGAYDGIRAPVFSWDGRIAYVAAERVVGEKVVVDSLEGARCDSAYAPAFDLSGEHLAYVCRNGRLSRVVKDGKAGAPYDTIHGALQWSRAGALAYVGARDGMKALVIDDREVVVSGAIVVDTSLFSLDARHFACWAWGGERWLLIVDGRSVRESDQPMPIAFSPDGRHVATAEPYQSRYRFVLDGQPGWAAEMIRAIRFSPDGRRIAYVARDRGFEWVVVDGAEGARFPRVGAPVFSPDSRRVAYRAVRGDRACVVVDGKRGPDFDAVVPRGPSYRPDGTLEYLAIRGATLLRVRHVPR